MKKFGIVIMVALAGCASQRSYHGQKVTDMPFPVAGGTTLMLPVTDGGPIPAQNDDIKIQVAGFVLHRAADHRSAPELSWTFAFTSRTGHRIEQVLVEEVGQGSTPRLMLADGAPRLEGGNWSGSTKAVSADPESAPWLYANSASVFVFKFSIKPEGMPVQTLYQPSWFSAQAKQAMMSGYRQQPRNVEAAGAD